MVMKLKEHQIKKFKEMYKRKYDVLLSDREAVEMAHQLVFLVETTLSNKKAKRAENSHCYQENHYST